MKDVIYMVIILSILNSIAYYYSDENLLNLKGLLSLLIIVGIGLWILNYLFKIFKL